MNARLFLYGLRHRLFDRNFIALIATAAFAIAGVDYLSHRAFAPQYTLTVIDYNLNPSNGNALYLYQGSQLVSQGNVFQGTLLGGGRAQFKVSPGAYLIYVTRATFNTAAQPSGRVLTASVPVTIHQDLVVDFLEDAKIQVVGD